MRCAPLASFAVLGFLGASTDAQTIRLNGPLAQPLAGDVVDYRISPDATHVAFRADQAQDDAFELFAAPLDGSAGSVRLHAPLPDAELDVADFAFAAGGLVVYRADLGTDEQLELYAAPRTGSASPTSLSGPLVAGGDVLSFQLTPDLTRVVFRADKLVNDRFELFSVPVDGSAAPLRLDTVNRKCVDYRVSPDGTFVLFSTGLDFDVELLHRVPIDASQVPVQVADSGPPGFVSYTFFEGFEIASDSQHAAFVTDELFFDRGFCAEEHINLFGIDLDDPYPTQLNTSEYNCYVPPYATVADRVLFREPLGFGSGDLVTIESDGGGRVVLGSTVLDFVVSPDEARVVFRSGSASSCTLRSAPIDGSAASTALAGPGAIETPQVSPGGSLVCFIATDPGTMFRGLYAVPISGGAPLLLNGPPIAGRGAEDFAISPSGGALVYREDRTTADVLELWSVGLDLVPHCLSGELTGFHDVLSFQIAPDGQSVVHLADRNTDQTDELFGTPIDSDSPRVQFNEPLLGGPVLGDVAGFQVTLDGSRVVYRADQDVDDFFELYSTPVDGAGDPLRLVAPLSDASDVQVEFALSPSGERVLFKYATGLYSVPATGAEPPVLLDVSGSGFPFPLAFVGEDVVYRRASSDLRRVAIDGSGPPIVLADPAGALHEFQLSPDGSSVVYRAGDNPIQLFSVPSDGSGPPALLNTPLVSFRNVDAFRITPDSSQVVYRADRDFDDQFELFKVPIDGSAPEVQISGNLIGGGDVAEFLITADSSRVVYRADQVIADVFELYGVSLHGPVAVVRLTPLPVGRDVESDFALSASGAFVAYRADALTNDVQELFVATTATATTPLHINAALVSGGDVTSFTLVPDLSRIVYRADQDVDQVFQLYGRGAVGPVVALATLPASGDVSAFRIDKDQTHVDYLADRDADDVMELFSVPLDGSRPPRKRHASLPATGDVQPDFESIPGNGVVFRADAEGDELFELFSTHGHVPALAPAAAPTATRSVER